MMMISSQLVHKSLMWLLHQETWRTRWAFMGLSKRRNSITTFVKQGGFRRRNENYNCRKMWGNEVWQHSRVMHQSFLQGCMQLLLLLQLSLQGWHLHRQSFCAPFRKFAVKQDSNSKHYKSSKCLRRRPSSSDQLFFVDSCQPQKPGFSSCPFRNTTTHPKKRKEKNSRSLRMRGLTSSSSSERSKNRWSEILLLES